MQIETLKDVLHWSTEFHQHLSQCLSHCADKNTETRAQMVLSYLAEHESFLQKVIQGFEASGDVKALNTWCYEYVNRHPVVQHEHCDAPFGSLSVTEIMDVIVDQHNQLIELYRYLYSRADRPSMQELLQSLVSLEEHELGRMVQSVNRISDI